eukprot:TRINITY_DN627_c0_g1_i3.p1 TRINITY_DN627_c0_g1~~TRINITY_DN627_c0_g1_i3.p1  ORF type:complete len:327 (+),score=61.37 TRINITY_DN627_c0_g1_i3:182-1162(+)
MCIRDRYLPVDTQASDPPPPYVEDTAPVVAQCDNDEHTLIELQSTITISITDGATVVSSFEHVLAPDMQVSQLRAELTAELLKFDEGKKIRLLICKGQILKDSQALSDTKLLPGDTLQMLIAPNAPPPPETQEGEAPEGAAAPAGGRSPRSILADFGVLQQQHIARTVDVHGLELQDEVERWGARVKIWTCMLLLLYSFKLLVGLSQSMETKENQQGPSLAFDLLGFWVAYIGSRAASRLNLSLARGYLYGQVVVAVYNLFLIVTRDPAVSADGEEVPYSIMWLSLGVNLLFWGYIVFVAYRFQHALFAWFSEVHPDLILDQHSDM